MSGKDLIQSNQDIVSSASSALKSELAILKQSKGDEMRIRVLEILLPSLEKIKELAFGEVTVYDGDTVYTKEPDLKALTYLTNLSIDILGREERLVKEVRLEKKESDMLREIYKMQVTNKGKSFDVNPDGSVKLD